MITIEASERLRGGDGSCVGTIKTVLPENAANKTFYYLIEENDDWIPWRFRWKD